MTLQLFKGTVSRNAFRLYFFGARIRQKYTVSANFTLQYHKEVLNGIYCLKFELKFK